MDVPTAAARCVHGQGPMAAGAVDRIAPGGGSTDAAPPPSERGRRHRRVRRRHRRRPAVACDPTPTASIEPGTMLPPEPITVAPHRRAPRPHHGVGRRRHRLAAAGVHVHQHRRRRVHGHRGRRRSTSTSPTRPRSTRVPDTDVTTPVDTHAGRHRAGRPPCRSPSCRHRSIRRADGAGRADPRRSHQGGRGQRLDRAGRPRSTAKVQMLTDGLLSPPGERRRRRRR